MTQVELAIDVNFQQCTVSKWERGTREPDMQTIIFLCKYFNVSADYLLGLSDDM